MKRSTRARVRPSEAGRQLLAMTREAEHRLAQELGVINALNVFPVPDGDTGTNMLATIREALAYVPEPGAPDQVAGQLAAGAMLGARGNSGVILSQLFRAQNEILGRRAAAGPLTATDLAKTFVRAAELAYQAVSNPVEGTMLTVLRATAQVASAEGGGTVVELVERLLPAVEGAVAATPEQLPILRDAGVIDSGGYGLLILLRAWYAALCSHEPPSLALELLGLARARQQAANGTAHPADLVAAPASGYGNCVTLLVEAPNALPAHVREQLEDLGDSVLVVAVDRQLKLHVHVPDPEPVLRLARSLGTINHSEISNIDEQTSAASAALPLVAVAPGEGLSQVFRSLGATVIAGGPTHNPSTADFLNAARPLPGAVFLLPNNGNTVAAAQQAAAAAENLVVVPTLTAPQGIAAVLAHDPEAAIDHNLERMSAAAAGVRTAEFVTAARPAKLEGIEIATGQLMVLLDGELLGVEQAGLAAVIDRLSEAEPELATIYYGAAASEDRAKQLRAELQVGVPDLQVEIVRGDQPYAVFIVGFE